MSDAGGVERVDVFSVKGGVGKTTVSVLLARAQAAHSKKPVLLIDADLTGTCLGDLVAPNIPGDWNEILNLAHLICDPPETLDDAIVPSKLPVYAIPEEPHLPPLERHVSALRDYSKQVLYCPSHGNSTSPRVVDTKVLHALAGHETAGGWVRLVIEKVIKATQEVAGTLGGVVVDHSPGLAALQSATLDDITSSGSRRALFVTSCDRVDLKMTSAMVEHRYNSLQNSSTFLINRVRQQWRDQEHVKEVLSKPWLNNGLSLLYCDDLRAAYENSSRFTSKNLEEIERVRKEIFGD